MRASLARRSVPALRQPDVALPLLPPETQSHSLSKHFRSKTWIYCDSAPRRCVFGLSFFNSFHERIFLLVFFLIELSQFPKISKASHFFRRNQDGRDKRRREFSERTIFEVLLRLTTSSSVTSREMLMTSLFLEQTTMPPKSRLWWNQWSQIGAALTVISSFCSMTVMFCEVSQPTSFYRKQDRTLLHCTRLSLRGFQTATS